jgi:hypothetical protein
MVNVSTDAGQQELRAAQLTINWGSCAARLTGAIHFRPKPAFGRDAAQVGMRIGRFRNSWSRKLETPGFLLGFSDV